MLTLRDYQRNAIDSVWAYFRAGHTGNPLICAPTGSGKSLILSAICKEVLDQWPDQRLLIVAHTKELLQQNFEELIHYWPDAPAGLYSAGLGLRQLGRKITIGGIQSIYSKAAAIGWKSLLLIDECFTGDTLIEAVGGLKRIDLMRCGDYVYTGAGVGVVSGVSAKPANDLLNIEFSDGTRITCTPEHRIFTERGWTHAQELEVGEISFSKEGVRLLWEGISAEAHNHEGRGVVGSKGVRMEADSFLLRVLCEEIRESDAERNESRKDESISQENTASTYSAWRQRAIAALGSTCAPSRARRGVAGGACDPNTSRALQRCLSELLQSRHRAPRKEDCDRIRRRFSRILGAQGGRCKKSLSAYFPRVVHISRVEQSSARTVYNLRVDGHPSYFANGKLVHNCHRLPHDGEGTYHELINGLKKINPHLRVIGLTATPYRMKSGLLTEPGGLFTDIVYDIELPYLIANGYLCPVISKSPEAQADLSEVRTRGGEYVPGDAARAMDDDGLTREAIAEIRKHASDRQSIMVFCAGVDHAENVARALRENGFTAECVSGETDNLFRAQHIQAFKERRLRFLVNCDVLTTGFNAKNTDCIVLLRPTKSTGLYVQIVGRGMRTYPDKRDCLVLDFAGNIERHGPVDMVRIQKKSGGGAEVSTAPVKVCPKCRMTMPISLGVCPGCGTIMVIEKPAHDTRASTAAILSAQVKPEELEVESVAYKMHKKEGKPTSLRVMYHCKKGGGNLGYTTVSEWVCLEHPGYAFQKAVQWWLRHHKNYKDEKSIRIPGTILAALDQTKDLRKPSKILVRVENGFDRVVRVDFHEPSTEPVVEGPEDDALSRYNI